MIIKSFSQVIYDIKITRNVEFFFSRVSVRMWGFLFLEREFHNFFQIHSKCLYKHPNDSRNLPEWLLWSCETCLRRIRNHLTTENYFLKSVDFENFHTKVSKNTCVGFLWHYESFCHLFVLKNEEFRFLRSACMTIIIP